MRHLLAVAILVATPLCTSSAANAAQLVITPIGIVGDHAEATTELGLSSTGSANRRNTLGALSNPTDTAPLPEPQSWAMMIVGFALVGARRRALRA